MMAGSLRQNQSLYRAMIGALVVLVSACSGSGAAELTASALPSEVTASPQGAAASPAAQPSATMVFVPRVETARPLPTGWEARAPLPTARTEVAVAALNGRIYVAGGYAADGSTLDVVDVYDPATDSWATAAPLPEGRNHMGLAALAGRLYAVGGYGGPISASAAAADVWAYDPEADSWSAAAPLPTPRAAHALVASDGRLFVIGGVGPEARTTLVYAPGADGWAALAPLPTEREHLAGAALEGRIYAVAGRAGGRNLGTVEVYVIAEDRWEALPALLTTRSGLAAAALEGQVYVAGGEAIDGSGQTFAEVERFDPASGQWTAAEDMPTARHGLGAVVVDGVLYVLGGGPVAGLTVSGANERYVPEL